MIKLPKAITAALASVKNLYGKEKLLLYGAAIFVSVALVDLAIVEPYMHKMGALEKEISDTRVQISADLKLLQLKRRIEMQRAGYSSYLATAESENEEFTLILKEIEAQANKALVNLSDMKPGGVKDAGQVRKFTVNVNCEGEMEQLVAFFHGIETSRKLLVIDKYELTPKSRDTALVKCTMSISKLALKEPAAEKKN